jgi:hypothetical protein
VQVTIDFAPSDSDRFKITDFHRRKPVFRPSEVCLPNFTNSWCSDLYMRNFFQIFRSKNKLGVLTFFKGIIIPPSDISNFISNEATFCVNGTVHRHNCRHWSREREREKKNSYLHYTCGRLHFTARGF